ncbi:MAG: cytochrome d ubiquinol oxidase subunit II [Oligoflexales bacterium]|nr:cytochrome d ubiquinol oxidase subunit II [Oligoflexales bacterium]
MAELQITWFFLVGILLSGYAVLDGFDLGVGFWHFFAKEEKEKSFFIESVAPFWDGNEVWLLTGGGAIFAAFPPVYSSIFSGFYLAFILVLMGLIFRAVSIEYRGLVGSQNWKKAWDMAFAAGSTLSAILFGIALGNIVRGIPLDNTGSYTGSFFDLLNPYALLVGLTGLSMFAVHGAVFILLKSSGKIRDKVRRWFSICWWIYAGLFLVSTSWSIFGIQRGSVIVSALLALIALSSIALVRVWVKREEYFKSFLASSSAIISILGAVGASLFPNLVPASNDADLSLSIYNSSSSQNTLIVMTVLALLGMPVVIGYTVYIYRVFSRDGP